MEEVKKNTILGSKKKTHHRRPYRLIPVALAGFLGSLLLMVILILLFSLVAYIGRFDIENSVKAPSIILFLSVLFGTFISGIIIGGTSGLPGSIIGGCYFIISLYQSIANHPDDGTVSAKGIFLKLILLVAAVLIGWFISWVLTVMDAKRRKKKHNQRQQRLADL